MRAPILAVLAILGIHGSIAVSQESNDSPAWVARDHVRAFYSGHSLSAGVPEAVSRIALSLGHRLDFEVQVAGYSLLRQRTKGEDAAALDWPGYGTGRNRSGEGLNVAEELRQPRRLDAGESYDVLVATERHDLPRIARAERTAFHLADMAGHLLAGNADGEVLLYHTWLNIDFAAPLAWVAYERTVATMWECVASRANLDLPARGAVPRVRVLPGGGALAEMVAALWEGKVPGIDAPDPGTRVRLLFSDNVHMSEAGVYFMALVHYAILFGRSPEGAEIPASLPPEMGRHMQALAWEYADSYGRRANVAAQRDMAACRDVIVNEICPAYPAFLRKRVPVLSALQRRLDTRACRRAYSDGQDPGNPFSSGA